MPLQSSTLFQTAALRALLSHELAALAPECAGVFGRQGLFIGCEAELAAHLSTPMLGRRVGLQVQDAEHLGGDVACSPAGLPFADESFRLVVVQHAFELIADLAGLREEVVRVLEPGGVAMICGFAPYGAWRPWLLWQGRNGGALNCVSAAGWRRALAGAGVDTYAQRRVGPARLAGGLPLPPLLRPSWLLLARKRGQAARLRAQTIALRPRGVPARLASGTQRASA